MTTKHPLEPIYDRDISKLNHFPKGVIVFDRDGTLVEDAGQHNEKDLLRFLPGALDAIKIVSDLKYGIVVASNQAGLEAGKFNVNKLLAFNSHLEAIVEEILHVEIALIVVCPHLASTNCECRKPKSGLLEAIRHSGLGEPRLFIGDAESDRLAALAYGVEFLGVARGDILEQTKNWVHINEFS
jgi:D-glycero-D-manno-heptose 1,7-bisphosphate phosphatase